MMILRKTNPKTGKHTRCEPAQSQRAWTFHKSQFVSGLTRKMSDPKPATHVWCESAQSKCTWTFGKSHFVWKVTGKMQDAVRGQHFVRACAVETHMGISQEPFCVESNRKNARRCSRPAFCASLRNRNAHGHLGRAILCGK